MDKLNPVIRGWANYYRAVVAKKVFSHCDHQLYGMLRRWAQRRHPGKGAEWVTAKYWGVDEGKGWTFREKGGSALKRHADVPIKRHIKVRDTASPYDGNLVYWSQRLREHPLIDPRTGYLLKLQKGDGARCGLKFMDGDLMETDHTIPIRLGGDDRIMNLQLLHRHCHDQKTAQDGSNQAKNRPGYQ